jgi:hypothetical protein
MGYYIENILVNWVHSNEVICDRMKLVEDQIGFSRRGSNEVFQL